MYTIGIDLGGTNIAVGLCDSELKIVDKLSTPTLSKRGNEAIVSDMADVCKKLIERNNLKIEDIDYVGIAAPGSTDAKLGVVQYANNIKMENYPIVSEFRRFFPIDKVYIENDANAAALGEALAGAAKGTDSSVMITLGTGVGGGIILGGKIFSGGFNCYGAEIGHTVIKAGGRQCTCGRRGCLEAYCSASALIALTEEKLKELKLKNISSLLEDITNKVGKVNARVAFDAMRAGDKYAKELVNDFITNLAVGITNIVNVLQPEIISIGGGLSNEKDTLVRPLRDMVNTDQYTRANKRKTKIVIAELRNDAGIVGAAGLGRQ